MSDQAPGTAMPTPTVDVKALVSQVADKIAGDTPIEAAASTEALKEEVKPEEALSPKFAALARKERKLTQLEKELRDQKAQMEADRAEYQKWKEDQGKPRPKKDPIQALLDEGYSLAEANEYYLNGNKPTADLRVRELEQKFESRIEKMEREAAEKEQRLSKETEERAKAQEEEAIVQFKESLQTFIDENGEKYELTKLYSAHEAVFSTIEEYFDKHQKVLSKEEAAEMVENYLEGELEKATQTKKYQAKYKSASTTDDKSKEAVKSDDKGSVTQKTLANTITASGAPVSQPARSEEERRRRAMEILDRGSV